MNLPKINDSKKMSKKHRREILASSSTFSKNAIGCSTVNEIENFGINASNDLAALRAIVLMAQNFSFNTDKNLFFDIFVDGNRIPRFDIFDKLYTLITVSYTHLTLPTIYSV